MNLGIRCKHPGLHALSALGFTLEFKPASVHQTGTNSKRLPKS